MSDIKIFTEKDGSLVSLKEADALISKTRKFYKENGIEAKDFTHNQVFGKARLLEILEQGGSECVGLKFHFIVEEALNNPSLIVQAIDENGKVLASSEELGALMAGPKCPPFCLPPIPPDN